MSIFKKAERKRVYAKIGVMGIAGAGKTYSAIKLARGLVGPTGRIAFIDTENRSASLYGDIVEGGFDVVEIDRNPNSHSFDTKEIERIIKAAVSEKYDALIFDSFSHFWEGILSYKDQLDQRNPNKFSNWGPASQEFNRVVGAVLQAPIHVICCMRQKMEYIQDGKTIKKAGLAPVMRDGIEYEFSIMFEINRDSHSAQDVKRRTNIFEGWCDMISEETGERIKNWIEEVPGEYETPQKTALQQSETQQTQSQDRQKAIDEIIENIKTLDAIEPLEDYGNRIGIILDKAGIVNGRRKTVRDIYLLKLKELKKLKKFQNCIVQLQTASSLEMFKRVNTEVLHTSKEAGFDEDQMAELNRVAVERHEVLSEIEKPKPEGFSMFKALAECIPKAKTIEKLQEMFDDVELEVEKGAITEDEANKLKTQIEERIDAFKTTK